MWKSVGNGASPAGSIRQPLTVWPPGFWNDQGMNARPAGAGPAVKIGSVRPTCRTTPGCSPFWSRYQTAPSGRTLAPVIDPAAVLSVVIRPPSRS